MNENLHKRSNTSGVTLLWSRKENADICDLCPGLGRGFDLTRRRESTAGAEDEKKTKINGTALSLWWAHLTMWPLPLPLEHLWWLTSVQNWAAVKTLHSFQCCFYSSISNRIVGRCFTDVETQNLNPHVGTLAAKTPFNRNLEQNQAEKEEPSC